MTILDTRHYYNGFCVATRCDCGRRVKLWCEDGRALYQIICPGCGATALFVLKWRPVCPGSEKKEQYASLIDASTEGEVVTSSSCAAEAVKQHLDGTPS
jgi:hypothetical protein